MEDVKMDALIEELRTQILRNGRIVNNEELQVNDFWIQTKLLNKIGEKFADIFKKDNPSKILTIETSGIPIAAFCALKLGVPFGFARKHKRNVYENNVYIAKYWASDMKKQIDIQVSKELIKHGDQVLIIDDFLSSGEAVTGLHEIIKLARAKLVGVGICIEKSFKVGAKNLKEKDIKLHSLIKIDSLDNNIIKIKEAGDCN